MKVLTIVFGIKIQKRTRQVAQLEEITYTNCLEQREMPHMIKTKRNYISIPACKQLEKTQQI